MHDEDPDGPIDQTGTVYSPCTGRATGSRPAAACYYRRGSAAVDVDCVTPREEHDMSQLTRRRFVAGGTTVAAATALATPGAPAPKAGGTPGFVPQAVLKIPEPVCTAARLTRN